MNNLKDMQYQKAVEEYDTTLKQYHIKHAIVCFITYVYLIVLLLNVLNTTIFNFFHSLDVQLYVINTMPQFLMIFSVISICLDYAQSDFGLLVYSAIFIFHIYIHTSNEYDFKKRESIKEILSDIQNRKTINKMEYKRKFTTIEND